MLSGEAVPGDSLGEVFWDALPELVAPVEVDLGVRVPLRGGAAVPGDSCGEVLRYANSELVKPPKAVLGSIVPLLGSLTKPPDGASASSWGTPRPSVYMSPRLF